jgi:hypothetical protein
VLSITSDLVAKFLPVNRSWAKVSVATAMLQGFFSFNMVCRSIQQLFFDVSKKLIKEDAIKISVTYFTNVKYFFKY